MSPTRKEKSCLLCVVILVSGMSYICSGATTVRRLLSASSTTDTANYSDSNVVDVTSFGARGDGVSDDTKAFQAAWQAVCGKGSTTLHVPTGYRFLVAPVTFSGPCQSNIVFK
ncbi:hypothetical protein KI387_007208, partial [Taxus chinensis]